MYAATEVFARQNIARKSGKYKVFVHEGGARSSKTTSIIQDLLEWAFYQKTKKRFIICRKKNTWCRSTVLYDFVSIMQAAGIYNEKAHNKNEGIIRYLNVEFWFGGLDDPQRFHGFTSDGFWINEANEATKNDFDQLEMRCEGDVYLDYNPNMADDHWIITSVLKRPDCKYIHSTVIMNPFAPENVRRKILSYEPTEENFRNGTADKNKWEIYGLGIRAKIEGLIFDNWELCREMPVWAKKRFQGIDFGYTQDPTAMGNIAIHGNEIYLDEFCYRTDMLTRDIIATLKRENKGEKIISESADPRLVDEIHLAGFNIHAVSKSPGSVMAGIDKIKSMKMYVTERSVNVIKELNNYKYAQDKNGKWLNEPIDDFNHFMDLTRYVVLMEVLGKNEKKKDISGIFH